MYLGAVQAGPDKIDIFLGSSDPPFGLLLKGVENVDRIRERDCVNHAVGAPFRVIADFEHPRAAEPLERLGFWIAGRAS